ncbi:MAG: hypothetical protein GY827_08380 [Cytophagales bacterium]|nr:hypothetical protein [Cytophagales bacterium]
MADKQLSFSIKLEGNDKILKNLTEAQSAVKELNKQLKETENQEAYAELEKELVKSKAALSEFRKEQKNQIRDFKAAQNQAGSYEDLNAQLVRARQEFKKLGAAERESAAGQELTQNIQRLDKELKELDESIGQSQRKVGSYEDAINAAFGGAAGQVTGVIDSFKQIGEAATNAGNLISKAFVALQAVQAIVEVVGAIDEFVDATREAQRQVEATFGTLGAETDEITVKIQALSKTFNVELDESLKATNNLVRQFGIDADEATNLLAEGLAASANQTEFIGLISEDIGKLSNASIDAAEAVGLITEATNKGINVDLLSEGIISLRENTEATADAIENAFGAEKAKEIADAFQEEPIRALKIVAAEQKKLDQNSKESAELIANVFKGVGEENIKSVQAIAELSGDLSQLGNQETDRLNSIREANEDLARAQLNVSNNLKDIIGDSEAAGKSLKAGLITIFNEFLVTLKPAIDDVKEFFGLFSTGNSELSIFEKIAKGTTVTLKIFVGVISVIINSFIAVVKGIKEIVSSFLPLEKAVDGVGGSFVNLFDIIDKIPAVINGVNEAIKQLVKNSVGNIKELILEFQIFSKTAKQALSFNADAGLEDEINDLKQQQKQIQDETISVIDAFKKGFNDTLAAQRETAAQREKQAQEETKKVNSIRKKGDAEARKEAIDAEKKRQEELEKLQKKFLLDIEQRELVRAALLTELTKRIRDNEINALGDTAEAKRRAAEAAYQDELDAITAQGDAVNERQQENEQKAIEAFGESSDQVAQLRLQQQEENAQLEEVFAQLRLQALKKFNDEELQIEEDAIEDQQKIRQAALESDISGVQAANNFILSKLEERFNKGLISEQEYNAQVSQLQQSSLQEQLDIYDKEIDFLQAQLDQGLTINEDYFNKLKIARQQLSTEKSKILKQETEAEKLLTENVAKSIGIIAQNVKSGIDQIGGFFDSIAQRDQERIDRQQENNERSISILESNLSQASGIRRAALQQELESELRAKEELARKEEEIAKRSARQQKAIAIAQAVINGALSITNILATVPKFDFGIASALQIAGSVATTAAQIATISTQQFAKGGILNGKSHSQGGIKTRFGELEGGEAVINKKSTKMFKPLLSRINEAGGGRKFAEGGILTPALSAPTNNITDIDRFANAVLASAEATNNRIDNIRVSLNTDEQLRDQQDQEENIRIATLSTDQNR